MQPSKQCVVCGVDGLHICSGCEVARYCSKDHQRSHLKEHKLNCHPYLVVANSSNSTSINQHLVVTKDLKAGEIFLKEESLVISPKHNGGPAVCLGCFKNLDGKAVNCPTCQWPMCGSQCWREGSCHTLGECSLLKSSLGCVTNNYALESAKEVYQSILVLRCLSLRHRDAGKWEKFLQLKYNESSDRQKSFESDVKAKVVPLVHQWLPDAALSEEMIIKICSIFEVHSFKLPSANRGDGTEGFFATFADASFIDHGCVANATRSFTKKGNIEVKVTTPISKGTAITLNYLDPSYSTALRQLELEKLKFGSCRCKRCRDPTELGSYTSGIYCKKCPSQEGILLSENPLDGNAEWACKKCSQKESSTIISILLEAARNDWSGLNRDFFSECMAFLVKYSNGLHPHHFYMTDIKVALCDISTKSSKRDSPQNRISDEDLGKVYDFAHELLKVVEIVCPGLNRLKGWILYYIFDLTEARNKRMPEDNSENALMARLTVIYELMNQVLTIFSLEPENSTENLIVQEVAEDLMRIKQVIGIYQLKTLLGQRN